MRWLRLTTASPPLPTAANGRRHVPPCVLSAESALCCPQRLRSWQPQFEYELKHSASRSRLLPLHSQNYVLATGKGLDWAST